MSFGNRTTDDKTISCYEFCCHASQNHQTALRGYYQATNSTGSISGYVDPWVVSKLHDKGYHMAKGGIREFCPLCSETRENGDEVHGERGVAFLDERVEDFVRRFLPEFLKDYQSLNQE